MTFLRRILREPVFSGLTVLIGHLEGSRRGPLNTGLTVLSYTLYLCIRTSNFRAEAERSYFFWQSKSS